MKYPLPKYVTTFSGRNHLLGNLFSKGTGCKIIKVSEAKEEELISYGVLRGSGRALLNAKEFWYIDHGYFGERDEYFRITRNANIHSGIGNFPNDRLSNFKLKYEPWKKSGSDIILCPPTEPQCEFLGITNWIEDTVFNIQKYSDRKIFISAKPNSPWPPKIPKNISVITMEEGLKNAWTVIAENSRVMLDSLIRGVPIICTNQNRKIGSFDKIEYPIYERESLLSTLAYNQWTKKDIESGKAWEELNAWG